MKGFVSALLIVVVATPTLAQEIVKSVDEAGNVTYSSSVPAGAVASETVKVDPPPAPATAAESQAKADEAVETAKQLIAEDEAKKAELSAEKEAANEAVEVAEQNLEDAKVIQDSDWQNLQGGGRVLNEGYHKRVKEAEAKVQGAKRAAAQTR